MAKTAPMSSFTPYTPKVSHRTIGRSYGDVGTGKTTFWLTGPKPVFMQSLDKGLEGTADQLMADGRLSPDDLRVADYDWHPGGEDFDQDYAIALRDRFIRDYEYALDNGARTIIWDKETDVWELFRYAEFGAPNDAPKNYAALNQRYIATINKVKAYDASLGLIQSLGDDWGETGAINPRTGKKTFGKLGTRSARGFDRLDELVFVNILHRREGGEFFLDISKCRQNKDLQDQTIQVSGFGEFGTLLIPGSTEEDWA